MTEQYLRKFGLVVSTGNDGLDLSQLRIVFKVTAADVETPNTLIARIYNASDDTAQRIQKEFQHVVLQAGYEGNLGVIFEGTIKQVKRGRENSLDSFVDIFAADGDAAYNFAVINKALAAGSSPKQQIDAIQQNMAEFDVQTGQIPASLGTGGVLPRGKVLFGMARYRMTEVNDTAQTSWSIQNGKLTIVEDTGYLPDEAAVVSVDTGMIGVPEATNNGIEVAMLLNPKVKIGTRLQLNNKDITTTNVKEQGFPRRTDLSFPASLADDGMYRVLVAEHQGDSRGQEWYTIVTCLAIDQASAPDKSVLANG